ncbi:hypothetical protein GCM10009127_13590 [Alteraurantiacibacter aestuarii]|uniref:Baseplate protein J-like domain-containing protein n=1 Tax=Alteraurantiacibacter aestuarii TaxID=650004 RepID=A0A844ZHS9_9SPHN|nr:hypothetical protein [Alteraurantiacibacter aestuarii]MXO88051.1 hypothetical protein [Alteraurantiacibacter aestuarii]
MTAAASTYLARDYASMRRLLIAELEAAVPGAADLPVASIEMTLIEAMAYIGDYLSYAQDAAATEAYLQTCRQRLSAARHAVLLGKRLNEGCCARTLLQFDTGADAVELPAGTQALSRLAGHDAVHVGAADAAGDVAHAATGFSTLHPLTVRRENARFSLSDACPTLLAGACHAMLDARAKGLGRGDILLFRHVESGWAQGVRLSSVHVEGDETRVEWLPADALAPAIPTSGHWQVLGNIAVAEEGTAVELAEPVVLDRCGTAALVRAPAPAFAMPFDSDRAKGLPLAPQLACDPDMAEPVMWLDEQWDRQHAAWPFARWSARRDLLSIAPGTRAFVPEVIGDDLLRLRFADDPAHPVPGDVPAYATYRSGKGARGNIAANTLVHLVDADQRIRQVSNPLPASGGCDAEPLVTARRTILSRCEGAAPGRCVTPADYAALVARHEDVAGASGAPTFANGLRRIDISVRRGAGRSVDADFRRALLDLIAPACLLGDVVHIGDAG